MPTSSLPVQVTSGAGMQMYRAAGADGQGNFVVLYDSQASSGATDSMVYAQQLDATGQPTGSPIQVNTDTTGSHFADGIAVNADGSFVAVWSGAGPGGDGNDVFFRRFGADGTPLDAQGVIVSAATAGVQDSASVSADFDGNFAIAWTDYGRDTAYNRPQSFVRLFDANGDAQTGDIAVETQDIGNPWSHAPEVSMAGNGTFVVAYQTGPSNLDGSGTGGAIEQFGYALDQNGVLQVAPIGGPIVPYESGAGNQTVTVAAGATAPSSPCTTRRGQRAATAT